MARSNNWWGIGVKQLDDCVACGGSALVPYLDLGEMPLANSFHDGSTVLPKYPLAVQYCRNCWHSQLTVVVDPHLMFDDYLYVSGTSDTLRQYFAMFASRFPRNIRVLDIASNDGSLLSAFENRGAEAVGIEPCSDLATHCRRDGLDVITGYWPDARPDGKFDIITAFNVLAHTADPFTFLAAAKHHLAPGGSIWVQTSQANMVLDGTFDAIYHEHLSYFTPRSIAALAKRAGLSVASMEIVPVHGGSMLVELVPENGIATRSEGPLYEDITYRRFAQKVQATIGQVRAIGVAPPIVGYGAAAKGMTFLNATGLKLDYIVDDNPAKHGLLTPGSNIPIGPVENLPRGEGMIVVLAWNFWDEILGRVRREIGSGHNMMRFFPDFRMAMS
jgi:2-polyprenyl-3-methyl-5-hydroxy-6-metoxy-1,4-benzoquinol methylase